MSAPDKNAPVDLTAEVRAVSEAVQRLTRQGLTKKAIIVLVSHSSKIGQRDVEMVLDHVAHLSKWAVKP